MSFKVGRCLLARRLREAGMTQQELCEKLNMPPSQVSDWVNDVKKMSLGNAKSVAHALGIHIDDLYEWIPVKPSERKRRRRQKE
ncbi:helix-turn-helix transcriptional regulator [Brevibacillus sp. WF146]|jgi:transcriptional regulator with XRE-family HTH domain|uniref:helix-turn-helix domain-containing protein n=1 Tax=Brevibacillus sp. WF146 TaxID=319501 RepID=UPI0007ED16FA|nr:helix-turn-helix transcriptional regulator [Brevibacillus sp. WF146]UYZ12180.1 helix-turn-helix transcriptional regulator [Brevibacillus sp. WF146]